MKHNFVVPVPRYVLTDQDKLRLEELAPLFDISFKQTSPATFELQVIKAGVLCTYEVKTACAHIRLLSELCELTSRWIYFHPEEHCAQTLFSQARQRLPRLVQLYKLCKQ